MAFTFYLRVSRGVELSQSACSGNTPASTSACWGHRWTPGLLSFSGGLESMDPVSHACPTGASVIFKERSQGARKMTQRGTVLTTKTGNLRLSPRICMAGGENWLQQIVFHVHTHTQVHPHPYTTNRKIQFLNVRKENTKHTTVVAGR